MPWLVVGRHYSHEVLLLAWSVLIGISYIAGVPKSDSLANQVHPTMIFIWALVMLASGIAGLVGCYWPGRFDLAIEVERGALLMQTSGLGLFSIAVFAQVGFQALTAGGICVAWMIANLTRVWNITKILTAIKREMSEGRAGPKLRSD